MVVAGGASVAVSAEADSGTCCCWGECSSLLLLLLVGGLFVASAVVVGAVGVWTVCPPVAAASKFCKFKFP